MGSRPFGRLIVLPILLLVIATVFTQSPASAGSTYGCGTLVCVTAGTIYFVEGCSGPVCTARLSLLLVGDGVIPSGYATASAEADCIVSCPPFGPLGVSARCAWIGAFRCESSDRTTLKWTSTDFCGVFQVDVQGVAYNAILGPGNRPLYKVSATEVSRSYSELVAVCKDGSVQTAYL